MSIIRLYVDNRERKVIPSIASIFDTRGLLYDLKNLTRGDYALIVNGRIVALFERKTWQDLAATIRDKKRHDNLAGLVEFGVAQGARVYYIIEGDEAAAGAIIGGLPMSTLRSHVFRAMQRWGIGLMRTTSPSDTALTLADFISAITKLYDDDKLINTTGRDDELKNAEPSNSHLLIDDERAQDGDNLDLGNDDVIIDGSHEDANEDANEDVAAILTQPVLKNVYLNILTELSGIGKVTAQTLIDAQLSLIDIWTHDDVPATTTKKLTPLQRAVVRAQNALSLLSTDANRARAFLSSLPGIVNSAPAVLEHLESVDPDPIVAMFEMTETQWQDVKVNGRRLGVRGKKIYDRLRSSSAN